MMPTRTPRALGPSSRELRERALAGFVLGGLALIGVVLMGQFHPQRGVYLLGVSLLFAAGAIVLSIAAGREARRTATSRPRTVTAGAVFGWVALVLGLLWALALTLFWNQLTTYSACMDSANTVAAKQVCLDQLNNSIGSDIRLLGGRLRFRPGV